MLVQILNIIVIVVFLTTIPSIMIVDNQAMTALVDEGVSIAPFYRDGYDKGKVQGIEDHRDGIKHNDRCPSENTTILWCIGYEIGYNDGYYDAEILGGNKTVGLDI
jgi:hypothetical protein